MRQKNLNMVSLGLLAPLSLVALLANAQAPESAVPAPLRSLPALIDAQYTTNLVPVTPELAEGVLLIDDVFVTPQGRVEVKLRNGGEKTITAWSLDFVVGSDSGASSVISRAEDKLAGVQAPDLPAEHSPLRPNDTRLVEYPLSVVRHRDASADRFARGDYSAVGVEVGAVVFDDGSVAGRDVRPVLSILLDRYARAAALSRLLGRVREAERAGRLQELLEENLESLDQEKEVLAAAIVDGPGPVTLLDSLRQQDSMLTQQWLMSLLVFTVRNSSRSELEDLGLDATRSRTLEPAEALDLLGHADPAMLRTAVEGTSSVFQAELNLTVENLPASLRSEIEGTTAMRIER